MTKLNKIKNLNDFRKYNIICTTTEEVRECLEMLEKSNFKVDKQINEDDIVVFYNENVELFACTYCIISERKNINFYTFKKIYNELKKQQEEEPELADFEIDENGMIIKINNYRSKKELFLLNELESLAINKCEISIWRDFIELGVVFSNKIALDNYKKYLTIHTKLKNLANRLNNGEKINWENNQQTKFRLYYDYNIKIIRCTDIYMTKTNNIYCLSGCLLEEAIKEIGEDDLKWYLQQTY